MVVAEAIGSKGFENRIALQVAIQFLPDFVMSLLAGGRNCLRCVLQYQNTKKSGKKGRLKRE